MTPSPPLLSIVMPSYNQGAYIAEAIESILSEDLDDLELIVMDGGSTDETVSVLEHYAQRTHLMWRSEPDQGLYHALNKAIDQSSGEWIGWLNSDDVYTPGTLQLFSDLARTDDVQAICGDAELFTSDEQGRDNTIKHFTHYRGERLQANAENLKIAHLNACFLKRSLLRKVGKFDTRYKICADRDYLMRLMRVAPPSRHTGTATCRYRAHPGSLTMATMNGSGTGTQLSPTSPAWEELMGISTEHMESPLSSEATRHWCRSTLASIAARQCANALLGANLNAGLRYARIGWQTGPLWILKVTKATVQALGRRTLGRLSQHRRPSP